MKPRRTRDWETEETGEPDETRVPRDRRNADGCLDRAWQSWHYAEPQNMRRVQRRAGMERHSWDTLHVYF